METENASEQAIDMLGGPSAVARIFDVTPWAVCKWRKRIPAERCLTIEEATEGRITRYQLRPDIFGPTPGAH